MKDSLPKALGSEVILKNQGVEKGEKTSTWTNRENRAENQA